MLVLSSDQRSAVIALLEAVRNKPTAKLKKQQVALEQKLSKSFAKHGVAFLKKYLTQFTEALADEIDNVFDSTAPTQDMVDAIQASVESGVELGANALVGQFDLPDDTFTLENPRAVKYLNEYGAQAVSGIDDVSKKILRAVLGEGIDGGWSYEKVSKAIRETFADFSTKRAKLIATTELGNAYQEGNLIVARDLATSGLKMQKSWLTVGDKNVDVHCKGNQDQGWIGVEETFKSGVLRPLDHPRCRCVLLYERIGKPTITPVEKPKEFKIPKYTAKTWSNTEQADSVLISQSNVKRNDIENDERIAIDYYQDVSGYKSINNALRSGNKTDLASEESNIKALDRLIKYSGGVKENLIVHRGMVVAKGSESKKLVDNWEPGKIFRELGYMSTTVDNNVIKNFMEVGPKETAVNITIRAPKGTKGVYMNAVAPKNEFTEERELLLARNTQYRVLSKTTDADGTINVLLEIVNK